MIRFAVALWGLALLTLVIAALWTSGHPTSDNLASTAFFVFIFGAAGGFAEAVRRGDL